MIIFTAKISFSMKKLLLLFFFFWTNILFSQNFQNICTPGTTFYRSGTNELKAFRMDSVYPSGNNDTMFISYRTIRDDLNYGCLDTTNGSVLGRTILKKGNGWFIFFNLSHDSIRLNTQAAINVTWNFFDLPDKGHIQALVTNIVNDSVPGTNDQVKIITLQAKDSNGLNLSHLLNQRSIRLSRHFGLSQMLDVHFIPDDTILYVLAGKSNPAMGLQDLTWQQIYDFNAGDEFHYSGGEFYPVSYPEQFYSYTKSEIYHVLEKTSFGSDSVSYSMEYCRKDTTTYPPSASRVHDTIILTYRFGQLSADNASWFTKLPEEFINQNNFADSYKGTFSYGNRQTKAVTFGACVVTYWGQGCWMYLSRPECPAEQFYYNYSEGLGTSHYQQDCYGLAGSHLHSKWNNLVYYRKGSESWGTPVSDNCWLLTGQEHRENAGMQPRIKVFPNPVDQEAQIIFPGNDRQVDLRYALYNYSGMRVTEGIITQIPCDLRRGSLASGLYILVISDLNGTIKGRAKVSFR